MQSVEYRSKKLPSAIRLAMAAAVTLAAPMAFAQGAAGQGQVSDPGAGSTQAALPTTSVQVASSPDSSTSRKPQELQAVQVTGTHIRQVDLATQEPVFTFTREDIKRTGFTTVGAILQHLTTVGISGRDSQYVGTPDDIEQGGSFANFRYLGASRVLVLVNGKRWTVDNEGMTDLSTIPTAVIERIEVLKDGASAIYGSDAISGVINIITRKRFQGAELDVHGGTTDKGDGGQRQISVTFGSASADNKSSLMMSLSYNHVGAIWNRTRPLTLYRFGPDFPNVGNINVTPRGRFTDSQGTFILNQLGDDTSNLANYTQINPRNPPTSDTYNPRLQTNFRMPTTQQSVYIQGRHDLTSNITFHALAMYSERFTSSILGPIPLSPGIFRGLGGVMSKDSIYNPTNEDITFSVIYPIKNRRHTDHTNRAMHVNFGLTGDFTVGSSSNDWNWDVYADFNKVSGVDTLHNQVNVLFLQRGIGPSFINAEGQPTCGTPANPLDTNQKQEPCIPINVLAGPAGLTPEIDQHLFIQPDFTYAFTNRNFSADITGGLFKIPFGGEVAFAAGAQYRNVAGFNRPELFKQLALTSTAANTEGKGQYNVRSAYAELAVPLVKDLPGVHLLMFDFATRYSRYNNFGSTNNAKIGFQYRPIDDLLIRGTYAKAFRAPTINDIAGGQVEGFDNYTDPCDSNFGATIYGNTLHAACVAKLEQLGFSKQFASSFRQIVYGGAFATAPDEEGAQLFFSVPNPNLKPETATTKTFGFVYSPHYVPGLTVSVDWWNVDLNNIISGISVNDELRQCLLGVQSFCDQFQRSHVTGQIIKLNNSLINRGFEQVQGDDLKLQYRLPETPIGQFTIDSQVSYFTKLNSRVRPDSPLQHLIGWTPFWRTRSNTSLSWSRGSVGATWTIRYFSSTKEGCAFGTSTGGCNEPDHIDPFHGAFPTRRIGAVAFNDLAFHWHTPWQSTLRLGVNNIFDRAPPIDYTVETPVLSAYPIDRFWFADYVQKF